MLRTYTIQGSGRKAGSGRSAADKTAPWLASSELDSPSCCTLRVALAFRRPRAGISRIQRTPPVRARHGSAPKQLPCARSCRRQKSNTWHAPIWRGDAPTIVMQQHDCRPRGWCGTRHRFLRPPNMLLAPLADQLMEPGLQTSPELAPRPAPAEGEGRIRRVHFCRPAVPQAAHWPSPSLQPPLFENALSTYLGERALLSSNTPM